MKKKKEITMWAIWCPFNKKPVLCCRDKYTAWRAWTKEMETTGMINIDFTDQGYRVVKGKFVWEEK